MKKPNFGSIFFRFEIYQKIAKITNFQNRLKKLHRVPWCCKTVRSEGFVPLLNHKIEKKAFHRFQPIKSAHDWGTIWRFLSSYEPQNRHIVPQSWSDLMGWKRCNVFFSILKLSNEKKPFECTVLQHQKTRCGFSNEFWKLAIFESFW